MNREIIFKKGLDLFERYLFGTLSSNLIAIGIVFLLQGIPGFWDYVLYAFNSMRMAAVTQPDPAFQWPQYFGSVFFVVGVFIKYKNYRQDKILNLTKEKTKFKETYHTLSDEFLQDEFERLYKVKYANVKAIKNILSHSDNKNLVIALFEKAHPNIEVFDDWFKTKGKFMRLRYNVGFIIWIGFPLLAILVLFMGMLELFFPGVTQSGKYAIYAYAVLFLATIIGAIFIFQDLKTLGYAITLVNKYRPEK